MEHVVYILGAGFSAPLGLPVVSNFLVKARDLYARETERYAHFREVFAEVSRLSYVKNFFDSDLYDIEEILSILQMQAHLDGSTVASGFSRFIIDVVDAFTPQLTPYGGPLPDNWKDFPFGKSGRTWSLYGNFVGSVLNVGFNAARAPYWTIAWQRNPDPPVVYDVISFNYDCVLERVVDFIRQEHRAGEWLGFARTSEEQGAGGTRKPILSKLHGSTDAATIIPPTWSKSFRPEIEDQWRAAHRLLRRANHIRVLGYSLPTADSYVKYLLKSALARTEHMKSFDVFCYDPDGTVKGRYDAFVNFKYYRFRSGDVCKYLYPAPAKLANGFFSFASLEEAHHISFSGDAD